MGNVIKLIEPTKGDWQLVQGIWEDPETMEDVGGVQPLSEERYNQWYQKMFVLDKDKNKYFLILQGDTNQCIGEISFHNYDKEEKKARLNIKIKSNCRNHGFGRQALDLLLHYYFNVFKGEIMEDRIDIKNTNGYKTLKNYGFKEISRDKEEIIIGIRREEYEKRGA